MRVIHLHRDFVSEGLYGLVVDQITADDVANGTSDEEIFLNETKFFSGDDGIGEIEDTRNVFAGDLLFDGADVISAIEDVDIEIVRGARLEETQIIDRVSTVSGDGHVIGHTDYDVIVRPGLAKVVGGIAHVVDASVERNDDGFFGALDLEWSSVGLPAIGFFALEAVGNLLTEKSVLVVDAIAETGHSESRHGFEETSGETSAASVAESGISFAVENLI